METPALLNRCLRDGLPLRRVESNLYSVLDDGSRGAPYDNKAEAYDRMISSDQYLRIAWGANRSTILSFMDEAFAAGEGFILDLAAGTSLDAYRIYTKTQRPTVVVDLSLEMLRRGKERLTEEIGRIPAHIVFVQADALDLPFEDGSFETILCHGGYHLFPFRDKIVSEWKRTLNPAGQLFATSLVNERWLGNVYLTLLSRLGEVNKPISATQFSQEVGAGLDRDTSLEVEGNFAYVRA